MAESSEGLRTSQDNQGMTKTVPIIEEGNGKEVLLKSQMREKLKSCSVRGLIAASERRWL